ncbi:MAG: helix-turn-helix transcriptional regulator [Deltaproteobacteria bacterium]|nr:helix-turn-helix transcriptional regulator [Deltaproteobacteria bacterium]
MAGKVDIGSQVSRGRRLAAGEASGPLPQNRAAWENCLAACQVDEVPAGVALLDRDFVLRRQNHLYSRYLAEYSPLGPQKAIGCCYFDYMPGSRAQLEGMFRAIRDQQGTRTLYQFELRLGPEAGNRRTLWDAQLAPLTGPGGRREGILVFCQDRTPDLEIRRQEELHRARLRRLAQREKQLEAALSILDRFGAARPAAEPGAGWPLWLVLPLAGLAQDLCQGRERDRLLALMEGLLSRAALPAARRLAEPSLGLTPREVEVAGLVMAGKTSKDIAAILGVTKAAVDLHRNHLRAKLGLTKKSQSLRDHLLSG